MTVNVAFGHEYWLDPVDASVKAGARVVVDIRNGEKFSGAALPYNKLSFRSISLSHNGETKSYEGRLGDYPAIHEKLNTIGLHAVTVNSVDREIVYKIPEKFTRFLNYHGLDNIAELHRERQLPETDIVEKYRRYAKTLLQVTNDGEFEVLTAEQSRAPENNNNAVFNTTDTEFELVLLDNPVKDIDKLDVQVFYQGKALADRQVEMFWKGQQVRRFTNRTDKNGVAGFKLPGNGAYLLNTVHMTVPDQGENSDWRSWWASVTFERRSFGGLK